MEFQNLNETDKEMVSALHHLALANWVEAARLAWVSYQAHGRGAVLLDFRLYESPPDQLPFSGYARQQDIAGHDDNLAQLRELVETYDPQKEVILVVYTPLGDTFIERLSALEGRPTPPEAARQG